MRSIGPGIWICNKHWDRYLCGRWLPCSVVTAPVEEYKKEDLVLPLTWIAFGLGRGTWSEIALGQHKMVLQVHLLEMRVILLQSREHIPMHETY